MKRRNETKAKNRKTGQVNRWLHKDRRKETARGGKTRLYASFIMTQQCKDDS